MTADPTSRYWSPRRVLVASVACLLLLPGGVLAVHMAKVAVLSRIVADDVHEALLRQIPGDRPLASVFNLDGLTIPVERILPGGPPKDGIPALTDPASAPVDRAELLEEDRVVGLAVGGEARAYPIRLLNHHEVINDRLGGVPVAVVFCPLCDSASVVDRRVDGRTLEFGVSGLLHNSNVLLYDRTDDALWSQIGFEAVSGPHAGRALRHLDGWRLTSFADWRDSHPRSTIATFETGHRRDYARNPYAEYLTHDRIMFPVPSIDPRLPRKAPVIGVVAGDAAKAYPVAALMSESEVRIEDRLGTGTIVLAGDPESGRIDVVAAPPDAKVVHTFWFAWAAFHPLTEVFGQAAAATRPAR
ncbi:MAG: DUF3179 domain-containing protein [Planctomycetota bacterium]